MDLLNTILDTATVVILVVFWVAFAGVVGYVTWRYIIRGLFARTSRTPAIVVLKWDQTDIGAYTGRYGLSALFREDPRKVFFVTFDSHGQRLTFEVHARVYDELSVGDTGLLVHRGNLYGEFIKGADGWSDPVQAPTTTVK